MGVISDARRALGRVSNMQRAVFMDRDGTITKEVGYVNHPSRLELLPNSAEAIRLLNQHGLFGHRGYQPSRSSSGIFS